MVEEENHDNQFFPHTHNFFHPVKKEITSFNLRPNDKNLGGNQIGSICRRQYHVANMLISLFDRVENIVGKGENTGYQHFLLFPQCFQNASFSRLLKIRTVW